MEKKKTIRWDLFVNKFESGNDNNIYVQWDDGRKEFQSRGLKWKLLCNCEIWYGFKVILY